MEFRQYLVFLQRWLALILVVGLGLGAAGYLSSMRRSPLYESVVTVLVNPPRTADRLNPNYQDLVTSERRAITYSLLLTKRSVMEGVVENLGLDTSPGGLAGQISVEFLKNTELINVTVRDTDPERAALIANEVVTVFNAQESELLANPYAATLASLHAVEPARRGSPVPSEAPRNGLLALIVGVLAVVAFGIIWEHFDDRIRGAEQIEETIGLAPLATIGRIRGLSPASRLVTVSRSGSFTAEAYRMVRAHLDAAAAERPIGALVVASAATGDGKSTTAANIAAALAQTSMRVILVDANLRQPSLHAILKLENGRGLSDLLARADAPAPQECLVPTGVENLRLLSSGSRVSDPARLLGGPKLGAVIAELKQHADLLVIDSPQLLGIVDASLLARHADAALLVVRAGATRARTLQSAFGLLARSQTPLLGVVLNFASRSRSIVRFPGNTGGGRWQPRGLPFLRVPASVPPAGPAMSLSEGAEQRPVAE